MRYFDNDIFSDNIKYLIPLLPYIYREKVCSQKCYNISKSPNYFIYQIAYFLTNYFHICTHVGTENKTITSHI